MKKLRLLCKFSDHFLRWFFTYLHGRVQTVVDEDGSVSAWLRTLSGVPQGSVLRPSLFLIYTNNLPTVLRYCKHMIFADDAQIYLHCKPDDVDNAINLLNEGESR